MDEYIKRETALKAIDEYFRTTNPDGDEQIGVLKSRRIIRTLPSAYVAPVRHGRWEPYHEADIGYDEYGVRCPNCGFEIEDYEVKFIMHYCPKCGTKMDGGSD